MEYFLLFKKDYQTKIEIAIEKSPILYLIYNICFFLPIDYNSLRLYS